MAEARAEPSNMPTPDRHNDNALLLMKSFILAFEKRMLHITPDIQLDFIKTNQTSTWKLSKRDKNMQKKN